MKGDLIFTEIVASAAVDLTSRRLDVKLFEALKQFQGHVVRAIAVDAQIGIANATGAGVDASSQLFSRNLLRRVEMPGPHTMQDVPVSILSGLNVAADAILAEWMGAEAAPPEFPSYGTIANGTTTTLINRWVYGFGRPERGKYGDDTSLAVGDVPESFGLTFATDAQINTDLGAACTMASCAVRISACLGSLSAGTHAGRPVVKTRTYPLVENRSYPSGNYFFAGVYFDAAQDVVNTVILGRDGSDLRTTKPTRYRELWALLRARRLGGDVQPYPHPNGLATATSRGVPLLVSPRGAQLSELETAGFTPDFQTLATHEMFVVYIPGRKGSEQQIAQFEERRLRAIAEREGRNQEGVARVSAKPSLTSVGRKAPWRMLTEKQAAKALARRAEQEGFLGYDADDADGDA